MRLLQDNQTTQDTDAAEKQTQAQTTANNHENTEQHKSRTIVNSTPRERTPEELEMMKEEGAKKIEEGMRKAQQHIETKKKRRRRRFYG